MANFSTKVKLSCFQFFWEGDEASLPAPVRRAAISGGDVGDSV